MIVIGLDPGLATTGYGLVSCEHGDMVPLAHGVISTAAKTPMATRLMQIRSELADILHTYRPDAAAVEKLYFATNVRTAFAVGQARGVILLTLAEAAVTVSEYTPLQIKLAATGYGHADKAQVQQMVQMLLSLDSLPKPDDAADALAACICHVNSTRFHTLAEQAGEEGSP